MALKKSDFGSAPELSRSKNLNALKRKASVLTLEEALNCIFCNNSASKLSVLVCTLGWCRSYFKYLVDNNNPLD